MKIFREVKGIEEPEETENGSEKKEERIVMKPVEGQSDAAEDTEKAAEETEMPAEEIPTEAERESTEE